MTGKYLTEVSGFSTTQGWQDAAGAVDASRACCEALESGNILFLPGLPAGLGPEELEFLLSLDRADTAIHKNISYRTLADELRGFSSSIPGAEEKLHRIMRDYAQGVIGMLSQLLAPYAAKWAVDYASYRPYEEENRDLPLHKRNDLVHTDAFPSRPTRGGLILRCFSNINPKAPRVWSTTERFPELARQFAKDAGLEKIAAQQGSALGGIWKGLKSAAGLTKGDQTAYDVFMLRFHDYLKENTPFQTATDNKIRTDFPPHSTWITFTDVVPHAVLSGQYALEQTFIIPLDALFDQKKSPARVLESIAGKSLIS
jgi:hypothetical protein